MITDTPDDTRDDPRWSPLRVTCEFDSPVIHTWCGLNLDGPLQRAAFERWCADGGDVADLPPLTGAVAVDFDLPVATWRHDEHWGWCTSDAQADWLYTEPVPFRGPTPHDTMKRFTVARSVNVSSGAYKPIDAKMPGHTPLGPVTWWVLGDADGLRKLLSRVRYIGAKHNLGYGKIKQTLRGAPIWRVEEIEDDHSITRDGQLTRRMPAGFAAGRPGYGPCRAPRWHRSRYIECVEAATRR